MESVQKKFILDLSIIFGGGRGGGADLADIQLTSKFKKGFIFLLCVIDIFSKYACVVPLKDKKNVSIVNSFQKILNNLNRNPNRVDKGSDFTIIPLKNG